MGELGTGWENYKRYALERNNYAPLRCFKNFNNFNNFKNSQNFCDLSGEGEVEGDTVRGVGGGVSGVGYQRGVDLMVEVG